MPDPWDAHADALSEGSARMGKVTRTTDFGAFIELVPQIEGLLHITELGRDLQATPTRRCKKATRFPSWSSASTSTHAASRCPS